MGLQQFERRLERLVEGVFAWAFRSGLQPVEIARRMTREMDLRRTVAPRGTIAPNQFTVVLSAEDRDRFEAIEDELIAELIEVANDHARADGYLFLGPVNVTIETDEDLPAGALLVTGEMVRAEEPPPSVASSGRAARNRARSSAARSRGAGAAAGAVLEAAPAAGTAEAHADAAARPVAAARPAGSHGRPTKPAGYALVLPDGASVALGSEPLTVGRLPECSVVLADQNVSRYHAEIRPTPSGGWEIADLGSTNGTRINGVRIGEPRALQPGDRITLGVSTLRFEQEPGW